MRQVLVFLSGLLLVGACSAGATAAVLTADTVRSRLELGRDYLRDAEYDRNIEMLGGLLREGVADSSLLGESYLLLIKTHLYLRNYLVRQPQGRTSAELNQSKARALVVECLSRPALRHLRPEPEVDYPAEMVQLFRDVRAEVQGGFRVTKLQPPTASVVLDGDTLRADTSGTLREVEDLPVGTHQILVIALGHVPHREEIEIAPGTVLERPYVLRRRHGPFWYGARAAVVGSVGTLLYLAGRPKPESDLPGPPPPPAVANP